MGLEYVNRKNDRYFLLQGTTKSGKPKYYCSRKPKGQQMDAMPAGFEWRENPQNGIVSVRRKFVSRVTAAEQKFFEEQVRELSGLSAVISDLEVDAIVVYTSDQSRHQAERLIEMLTERAATPEKADWYMRHANYSPMLRFHLHDEEERLYTADRWCFRGSVDDWIFIGGPGPLASLVGKFAPHLGEESFFELY